MPKLLIEKMVYGGKGIGSVDNTIYFCPFVLSGEVVDFKILAKKKHYIEVFPRAIIKASEKRVEPECPYFTECGGCDYQHIYYNEQLNLKKNILTETFDRIGKLKLEYIETFPSEIDYNYRNRIQLKLRDMKIGFYKKHSNNIVPIKSCVLVHYKINLIINKLNQIGEIISCNPLDIHIVTSESGDCILKILFLKPLQSVDKIIENFINTFKNDVLGLAFYEIKHDSFRQICLYGRDYIMENINNIKFRINMNSFFQINTSQLKNMMTVVTDYIKTRNFQKAADLYCGVGTFSIVVSRIVKKVIAIENNMSAINDALFNAGLNNCNNITFINKSVESAIDLVKDDDSELIIIDPPRSGLNNKIIESISKFAKAIIYIACDPTKQARDVKLFLEKQFFLKRIILIDMFPQTYHIESICILEKEYE